MKINTISNTAFNGNLLFFRPMKFVSDEFVVGESVEGDTDEEYEKNADALVERTMRSLDGCINSRSGIFEELHVDADHIEYLGRDGIMYRIPGTENKAVFTFYDSEKDKKIRLGTVAYTEILAAYAAAKAADYNTSIEV